MSKSPSGSPASKRPTTNTKKSTSTSRPAATFAGVVPLRLRSQGQERGDAPPPTRFRSRHPVITTLVPVGLVVAAIATMVVIKAAGTSNPPGCGVLTPERNRRVVGGTGTADTGTTTLLPQVVAALSVPAATLGPRWGARVRRRPAHQDRERHRPRRRRRQAADHVHRRRVLPVLRRRALGAGRTRCHASGPSRTCRARPSDSDVFPDTQTLSFYGSSYSSPYIDFQSVEEATNQPAGDGYQTLQTPTSPQRALVAKYDRRGASRSSISPTATSSPVRASRRRCCRGCPAVRSPLICPIRAAPWRRRSTGRRTTSPPPSPRSPGTSPPASPARATGARIAQKLGA